MAFSVFLEAFESRPAIRSIFGTACLLGLLGAAGCGDKQVTVARLAVAQSASGSVMGAQQPIAGAAVQLYAVGDTGTASPSTPLLSSAALTSSNGDFNFGSYTCPSASTNVYLTAVGGSTAGKSNALNPNFTAMTALGACGDVAGAPHIVVNELSTIAAVYALAPFMKSYSAVGAGPLDAQLLTDAFQTAAQMVNKQTGVVSVSTVTSEQSVSDKMRALANSLTSCVASAGGKAGDGSGCGTLFSLSTQLSTPPADIVAALLNIANNPTAQVDPLFLLGSTNAIFQPSLTAAPVDWKLLPSSPVSPPTFSPAAGTYPPSTAVTLASSSAGAKIYYTTDGSTPSTSSALYSAPVRLAATTTIRAVSVAAGVSSEPVAGTYTIAHPTMSLDPKTVSVAASKTQIFNASVTGTTNTAVKWALNPALGSITPLGLYVAPASISATQAITLTATSVADPTVSAASTITLVAPLGMSVSPLAVTLGPAQTQAFAVTSTVSANKAVTWSVKPAVGSISQNGAYTAPAAITASQTVTVVATSVADPSVSASAVLTLSPPVTVTLTPATVALGPLQTHDFIAAIAGTTNSAVTWSLNPAVGSISTSGMYTAPASIPSAQVITVTAASVAKPAVSAASTVTLVPPATSSVASATYYMAPNGSDSTGNGTQAKPWLTPNHAGLTCGDTVSAASGTYPTFTLMTTPGCSSHNAVFVKCAVFATCKVNGSQSQGGILVQASYWAVLGWEVTTPHGSSDYAACFQATPGNSGPIHDVYFINDIANGCQAGGFTSSNRVDYFAAVADIAYNAAQGNSYCYSGFSVYQPLASDTAPGTHIYLSQLFAWNNVEPAYCQGGNSTDGEGVILDTFNNAQGGPTPYTQQAVIDNVIAIFNGAGGIYEGGSGNSDAQIYMRNNTAYGNFTNTNQNPVICGQIESAGYPTNSRQNINVNTQMFSNLSAVSPTGKVSGCGGNPAYAYFVGNVDATTVLYGNAGYSPMNNNIGMGGLTTGFTPGTNVFGSNPGFANPVQPPAPACAGSASVIACMAQVISDFTPTNVLLRTFGYHAPSALPIYDPLFPKWLCNPNVPAGLTTMGCVANP